MEVPEILKQLERCQYPFPRAAVAEAITRREEITPELLRILESVLADPAPYTGDTGNFAPIFAMFLLAKFRETRAYPLIVRIALLPGETPDELLGDIITEKLGAILASVSGGDDTGLKALIENPELDEYVRTAALHGFVTLVASGQRTREEAMAYLAGLFRRLDRRPDYIWNALANCCADLWPDEVQQEIRQAYEDGLIEPRAIHRDDIREALALGKEESLRSLPRHGYGLIDDVEREMSWMSGFQPDDEADRKTGEDRLDSKPVTTWVRPEPKVGRNDPCPCGSGKKFKKCCGQ